MLPKKILIACIPADGHFNPLTGIAVHLKNLGHDVRWYTQEFYKEKIEKLGIPFYPFIHHPQINQDNFISYFDKREHAKSQIAKLTFDLEHLFIRPTGEVMKDMEVIHEDFQFDLFIADIMFMALPMVKARFNIPVVAVGIAPVNETSRDLPPSGLGLTPVDGFWGGLRNIFLRFVTNRFIFQSMDNLFRETLKRQGVENIPAGNLFDIIYRSADMVWQSGSPGFEYKRSDWNPRLRFIGPLLPHSNTSKIPFIIRMKKKYERIVLVTQGTAEKNVEKIIVPVLEAFKNSNTLVIATTGKSNTVALRARYPQDNFIIEDFIPFNDVMPVCDAYITNGGYGGVLLGIKNKLPMVVAGVHEGKSEICARVGYFRLGINLRTETPSPEQIRKAVDTITSNKEYKENVKNLAAEFRTYNTGSIVEDSIRELFGNEHSVIRAIVPSSKRDIA